MGALQNAAAGQPVTPDLAAAAAQAGAPPAGAEAGAGAPPPMPGAGAPPAGAAPPPEGAGAGAPMPAPGSQAGAPAPPGAPPPGADPRAAAGATGRGPNEMPTGPGGSPIDKYLEQADPREQQEYERAMRAMAKVLYGNDGTANAIVDQIKQESYVSDTSKVVMMFIKELDRKINMDESVISSITQEAVERISELAEARHQMEYKSTDMEQILGAAWEGVQSMFGNEDVEGYTQRVRSMRNEDLSALQDQNEAILSSGRG